MLKRSCKPATQLSLGVMFKMKKKINLLEAYVTAFIASIFVLAILCIGGVASMGLDRWLMIMDKKAFIVPIVLSGLVATEYKKIYIANILMLLGSCIYLVWGVILGVIIEKPSIILIIWSAGTLTMVAMLTGGIKHQIHKRHEHNKAL